MSSKIMNNAKANLYIDGVKVAEGGSFMMKTSRKRLKKDCPCQKCQHWRSERTLRKMQQNMAEAFTKSVNNAQIVFRTPIIDQEANMKGLSEYGLVRRVTSEPQVQNVPHSTGLLIGGKK